VLGEGMAHLHRLMGIGAVVRDDGEDEVALYRHV
jgi:hypothetical protein